ncbi:choline-sulfatase [Exophiala aquamarina CBS 119918]|uniref:Choline-sulfatase n=1 Tax=Exophiala aquamarina CBS 119918 TaxID=1182545 RepID=A0A072NW63_9EURO|nr:choline-sulfatase [Exophiala aquamarina CBS 119918]KEF51816.1 choline-sulfatase [Exophiala aquamarina CBS 119918]
MGSYDPFPASPPTSPPNGLNGQQDGYSAPLFVQQPNILFIMADQLAAPLLKMHNPKSQIKTPNLDKLAERSVVFDSAYCNSPLCAPSRMCLMSGQLPSKIKSYDNASSIGSDIPTYAHYLRSAGYETTLAGKMHFIGDQLHGYENRLTADIYPGDYGWAVNWDEPDRRLEWYHNSSSILQAGPCVRTNQLDYDEEVLYKSKQYLYDYARAGPEKRPFALTVSFTHPHDPYAIEDKYWDLYEGVDIDLPDVNIDEEDQDPHSKRLMHVCDLKGYRFSDEQIKRARRAYYGAVSYVDDNIGQLLSVLKKCGLDENTIVMFSGDHGDMLGERGLWYKMSYFENSVRVPMLISHPKQFNPHRVSQSVSTLDLMPTLVDLVGAKLIPGLPVDGISLIPHLYGIGGHDTVFAEYMGEGTAAPLMMIRRGDWKYITCPVDPPQLFNLRNDPKELENMATSQDPETQAIFKAFEAEAHKKWDFAGITEDVLQTQRQRRLVWSALSKGRFESWDWKGDAADDGRYKYIRSQMPLDDLERKARYPTYSYVPADMTVNAKAELVIRQPQHLVDMATAPAHYR